MIKSYNYFGGNMDVLDRLKKSKFRNSFHLNDDMREYVLEKGLDNIQRHAYDFINQRLKPKKPKNDGKQTPMKGHPVFISQHATATCCRGCLEKWHKIKKEKELNDGEIDYIVKIIMTWIKGEI